MELTAPFGYKSVTPLLREMRVRPRDGALPEFALTKNSLPIAVGEAVVAGHDYPLAFVATSPTEFAPVAILGVETGENLYASAAGWDPGFYVPAYVRRYPYCMSTVRVNGTDQQQSIICIEKDSIAEDGVAIFDAAGQPTPEFAQAQELLARFESEIVRTKELCQILADYKLLEPMRAEINIGEANFDLTGMFRVAEARLEHLMSNQLKNLIRKGGMALIYQHLSSLARFQSLMERKMRLIGTQQAARANGS